MLIVSASIVPPSVGHSCVLVCSVPVYDEGKGEWVFPRTQDDLNMMRQWERPKTPLSNSIGLKIHIINLWLLGAPYSQMVTDMLHLANHSMVGPYCFPYFSVYVDDAINLSGIEGWGKPRIVRCPIALTPKCDVEYSGLGRYEQVVLDKPYVHAIAAAEWAFDEMLRKLA